MFGLNFLIRVNHCPTSSLHCRRPLQVFHSPWFNGRAGILPRSRGFVLYELGNRQPVLPNRMILKTSSTRKHLSPTLGEWQLPRVNKVMQKEAVLPSAVKPTQLTHIYGRFFFFLSLSCFICSHCWFAHTWWLLSPMPTLGIPLKRYEPSRAFASGSSLRHVPTHLTSPGHCGAAGALLHARLELGDHWHLRTDRDGSWYDAFSLPSGLSGALWAWPVWSARHRLAKASAVEMRSLCRRQALHTDTSWQRHCFVQWKLKVKLSQR